MENGGTGDHEHAGDLAFAVPFNPYHNLVTAFKPNKETTSY